MKVRAKHNFNHNGEYHAGGEIFEAESLDEIRDFVEEVPFTSEIFPPSPVEKTAKRGRPRKA